MPAKRTGLDDRKVAKKDEQLDMIGVLKQKSCITSHCISCYYWGALKDVKMSSLHLNIIAAGTAARKYSMMNPIKSINNYIKTRMEKVG